MESTGGGESGEMCCDFREVGKVERIFSMFSVKNSTNLSAKSRGGFINGIILAWIWPARRFCCIGGLSACIEIC